MSKVVTIPKDRNPFVVIVNGVKHSYPAGVTTEVPDEVADVIEKYVGAKPKPDPNAGINFGGAQSDWNQTDSSAADFIKNKPFRVANLDIETFALDMTPTEIKEVVESGRVVLFANTMSPIGIDTYEGNITAVYASRIVAAAESDEGILAAIVFNFSPTDGSFMGTQTFLWSGGVKMG